MEVVRVGLIVGSVRDVRVVHLACPILYVGASRLDIDASSNPKSLPCKDLRRD